MSRRRERNRYLLWQMHLNDVNPFTVTCALCSTKFPRGSSPTQAADCAAAVYRDKSDGKLGILGHYGSDFDLRFMPFAFRPLPEIIDPICDGCIRAFLASGRITEGFHVPLPGGFECKESNAFWGVPPWHPFQSEEEHNAAWSSAIASLRAKVAADRARKKGHGS